MADQFKDFDLNVVVNDSETNEGDQGASPRFVLTSSMVCVSVIEGVSALISAVTPGWTQGSDYTENSKC